MGGGRAERPGLPGRKLFALAARPILEPRLNPSHSGLSPLPARCWGGGVPGARGMPGKLQQRQVTRWSPLCQILYVLGKPQAEGLPPTAWCCALRAGCAAGNECALRRCFSDVCGKCQSCVSGPTAVKRGFCALESHPESRSELKEHGPSRGARGDWGARLLAEG